MNITQEDLNRIKKFAHWLHQSMEELNISQDELAKNIGKSQKTISRYLQGNMAKLPDSQTVKAIKDFFEQKSIYKGFRHIPSEQFAFILDNLLKEFNISQQKLAEAIGKHQKDISGYIWQNTKADTETQLKILNYFYDLSLNGGEYSSLHFGTAVNLDYIINGEESFGEYFVTNYDINFGEKAQIRDGAKFLLEFNLVLSRLILDNLPAFYDEVNLYHPLYDKKVFLFEEIYYALELFRQLCEKDKKKIQHMLERRSFLGYPEEDSDLLFFEQLTCIRKMVSTNIKELAKKNYKTFEKKEREDFIREFEIIAAEVNLSDEHFIKQVNIKLEFTSFEWYIWGLLLIWDCNNDLLGLCDLMIEKIYGKIK